MGKIDDIILAALRDDAWRSTLDVWHVVQLRIRVSHVNFWVRMRALEVKLHIERRGSRGSYEWRRLPVKS